MNIRDYLDTAGDKDGFLHESYLDYLISPDGELKRSSTKTRPLIKEIALSDCPVERYKNCIAQVDSQTQIQTDIINSHEYDPKYSQSITPRPSYYGVPPLDPGTNDIVIFDTKLDRVSQIDLDMPNGWSAEGAIGKTFDSFHEKVLTSGKEKVIPTGGKISRWMAEQDNILERVGAVSFHPNQFYVRHPDDYDSWPKFTDPDPGIWIRFERQLIIPLGWGFAFLIRSNLVDCRKYPELFEKVFTNPANDHAYPREFLKGNRELLLKLIKAKK